MKSKKILIGALIACTLMLITPCISAVNEQTTGQVLDITLREKISQISEENLETSSLASFIIYWLWGWLIRSYLKSQAFARYVHRSNEIIKGDYSLLTTIILDLINILVYVHSVAFAPFLFAVNKEFFDGSFYTD